MKKYINNKELEEEVLAMYNDGRLDSEIEKELGFPPCTIYNFRKRKGLPTNRGRQADIKSEEIKRLVKLGKTAKEISEKIGIGTSAFREYCRRNGMLDLRRFKKIMNFKYSKRQLSILCGILMGDGTLYCDKGVRKNTYRFIVRHGPKQILYSYYIYHCLSNINCKIRKIFIKGHSLNGKIIAPQYQTEVRLNTSNYLRILHNEFYPNGKKIIPFTLLNKYYTRESLAFHFMDDGSKSCHNGKINGFILSMQGFSKEEIEHFKWFILGKFHLQSTVTLQNELPILRISNSSVNTFINLIKPYIIDSLKYKISPSKTP